MVEDKFDDSPAVCHVFDDQVFIRSAVYCPYWSYNAMPLFFLKRIHKQAFMWEYYTSVTLFFYCLYLHLTIYLEAYYTCNAFIAIGSLFSLLHFKL